MAFWDIFSSAPKAVDLAVEAGEGLIKGIDKIFYTDEEKEDARKEARVWWLEMMKTVKDESSVTALTRRYIAFAITGLFLLCVITSILLLLFRSNLFSNMWLITQEVSLYFGGIMFFYFSVYVAGRVIDKVKGKDGATQ